MLKHISIIHILSHNADIAADNDIFEQEQVHVTQQQHVVGIESRRMLKLYML